MTFSKALDAFCEDASIFEQGALSKLSLTGLQPCFEDTILVLPVFLTMIVLAVYRMHQCLLAGKYLRPWCELCPVIAQIVLCLANCIVTIMLLAKLDHPARFQQVVYPFGIAAWFALTLMNTTELFYLCYSGQWISRFLYLWIFVSYSVRWPTQRAVGNIPGSEFQWTYFLICWLCQCTLLILMYFTKSVTFHDLKMQQVDLVSTGSDIELTDIGDVFDSDMEMSKISMKERLKLESSALASYDQRLKRNNKEEEKEMASVPWTEDINPEGHANLFSRLTYSWMSPLMAFAHTNTIEIPDVWDLRAQFKSIDNFHLFENIFLEEKAKHFKTKEGPEREKSHPLRTTFYRAFGYTWGRAAPLLFIQNIAQLALPFLLGPLLKFLAPTNLEPLIHGYYYSFGFFLALMIMTLAENQYFNIVTDTGVRVKAALIPMIFRHSLKLSNQSRQERSVGAIVSHMSSDTDKIALLTMTLHNLWSAPLRLFLGVFMLISGLGFSGVVGLFAVILVVPVQTWVMKQMVRLNKEVMGKSDARIRICNEVLAGMRVIKYYAWEKPFQEKVEILRTAELSKLLDVATWRALNSFFVSLNPIAMAVGTFVAFALIKGNLTSAQAFQSMTLFGQMLWPLMLLPNTITAYFDTLVSVDRVESFLLSNTVEDPLTAEAAASKGTLDEKGLPVPNASVDGLYVRISDGAPDVNIENGTFAWDDSGAATLVDINLKIQPGSLVAIVGSTGSGKSSIINAMIGEMQIKFGRAKMSGSFAYAPQQAWIYNATVKENILFGLDYDEERYNRAIDLSCLRVDIENQFAGGDMTEIGEKGVNMSGGQRQRLNIARALYANSDILILDDPLSALDPHVGGEVFKNVRLLADKTRIFATNQLHLTSQFDRIIVVKNGRIIEDGTFADLKAKVGGEFHRLHDELGAEPEQDAQHMPSKAPLKKEESVRKRVLSVVSDAKKEEKAQAKADMGKLVKAETHSVGAVKYEVYSGYMKSIGMQATVIMVAGVICANVAQLSTSMWLGYWAKNSTLPGAKTPAYYVTIYAVLSLAQVLITFFANWAGFHGSVNASAQMHSKFMEGLMMSPIAFFDGTPMGRITNRMSKDMGMIDNAMMAVLQMSIRAFVGLIGMLVIIGVNTVYVLVAFVPVLVVFRGVQTYYRGGAVQLKRLDAVSRSPIYAHFNECLNGISTIRAYGAQNRMSILNAQRLDFNQKVFRMTTLSNRWLSIRLEFLGGLLILATSINTVIQKGTIDPSAAGVSMSYALQITAQLNMLVRIATEVEGAFNAVERVQEYMGLKPEPPHEGKETPPNWPDQGDVEIDSLVMSYVPDKPPCLRNLTLHILPGEKVGVVGRTGAGKSSLFQALFRMMEATSGFIKFDGIDISGLGLNSVRNAISIIPQEPVLFGGTLRFNLDPFNQYEDLALWSALEKAGLKQLLISKGNGLGMNVIEGGENFSVGQRQLVCLARALLKKSKILVLDEATANVDLETDALIQKTIRDNFSDRTTLTIAHRLNTVIDCDKILVLDLGTVREFDSPKELLSRDSEFASMVHDTGPENEKSLRATAMGDVSALKAQQDEIACLADAAKSRFDNGEQLQWSPLMAKYRDASKIMKSSWEERHSSKWDDQLAASGITTETWLMKMSELLRQVNISADDALMKEHITFDIHGIPGFVPDSVK